MEKGEFNVGPRDWQYLFAITRFRYIKVLFHIPLLGKENCSLQRGFRYMEVRYIEVQLYLVLKRHAVGLPPPQASLVRVEDWSEVSVLVCLEELNLAGISFRLLN